MAATALGRLTRQLTATPHRCKQLQPRPRRGMSTAAADASSVQLKVGVAVTLLRPSTSGGGYDTLLIKRGKQPLYGHWAFPGGSLEPGETIHHAAQREMREETSITVTPVEPFYVTEVMPRAGERGTQFVLVHVLAQPVSEEVGEAVRAADDAMEVRWMAVDAVRRMEVAMAERDQKGAAVSVGGEDALIVPHVTDVLDRAILLHERLFAKR